MKKNRATMTYDIGQPEGAELPSITFGIRADYEYDSDAMGNLMADLTTDFATVLLVKSKITLVSIRPEPRSTEPANPTGNFVEIGYDKPGLRPCPDNVSPAYSQLAVVWRKQAKRGKAGSFELRGCLTDPEIHVAPNGKTAYNAGVTPAAFTALSDKLTDTLDKHNATMILPAAPGGDEVNDARTIIEFPYWKVAFRKQTRNRTSDREKEATSIKSKVASLTKRTAQAAKDAGKTVNTLDATTLAPLRQECAVLTARYTFPVLLRNCSPRKRPILDALKS